MPQASKELRDYWGGVDERPAIDHLKAQGFKEHRFCWIKPSHEYELTERDQLAIQFLIDEWDWGGLIEPLKS